MKNNNSQSLVVVPHPSVIKNYRRVAIWGASSSGKECLRQLTNIGIEVVFFIDRAPPNEGMFEGRPVHSVDYLTNREYDIAEFDGLIVAMSGRTTEPDKMLNDLGFERPVMHFRLGSSIKEMFEEKFRRVAIWGASLSGEECLTKLKAENVEVAFFVDKNPPSDGLFHGIPTYPSSYLLEKGYGDLHLDAIILAMSSDNSVPKKMLKDAGCTLPVLSFKPGASVKKMFEGHLCINHLFAYDQQKEDLQLIEVIETSIEHTQRPRLIYGAGKLTRYLFSVSPTLASKIDYLVDDDSEKQGETIAGLNVLALKDVPVDVKSAFIASTLYLPTVKMTKVIDRELPQASSLTLNEILKSVPLESIPQRAWREPEYSIYPVDIPDIHFEPEMDFILMDVPPRFLCMMPNGLGSVHNILKKTRIKFQTIDLDLIFYHRYHSHRILDGMDEIYTEDGYKMQTDPWSVDTVEDEWQANPKAMAYWKKDLDEVLDGIVKARPKALGFSLHATNLEMTSNLVARIRQALPDIVIVVGGYDCVNPEMGPRLFTDYDYMVIFEAEEQLPGLVEQLAAGKRPKNLPGIISKYDRPEFPFIPAGLVQDLDSLDYPHYEWADISLYRNYNGYQLTPITLSRGCKWSKCTFCAERFDFRRRSAANVADEIEWLVSKGCKLFHFNDSDLSGDPETVRKMCEEIIARGIEGISLVGQLRVQKGYTPEYFETLYKAGFKNLRYGIDGWSKNTLKLHKKGYTLGMIEEVLRYTKQAGIYVTINLVIGIPHETEQDIDETIENMIKNKDYFDAIENLNTLILSTGGLYRENPEKHGIHFRKDVKEIDALHPKMVPPDLWYSVDPYIDQPIRVDRLRRIVEAAQEAGIGIGNYANWKVKKLEAG
jgi:hypothetical protein